ncbi:MAG TPA: serine/threonine protein kinase [Bacteroidetes bacterium]|nr:serine/threonine protein kinase [Bacteroidota bacterium]
MFRLRTFDLVMLVISLVIGMGIFRAPASVAASSGSETMFYLAWLAGGVIAVCGGLTFAEIGRRLPVTGAYYRVFARAYHPLLAFGVNSIIVVSNAASAAGVAIIGAEYVTRVLPALPVLPLACVFIVLLYLVNLAGLRTSVTMQNVLIGIKLALLACIIAAPFLASPLGAASSPAAVTAGVDPLAAFGSALIAVAFTYGGYQSTINFGGDASSDGRQVSRAIIIGVIMITALYLAATWAYVQVLGFETLGSSSAIASMVMERLTGPVGTSLVSVALTISVFGYINVAMLTNPRVITAMAEDGVLPKRLASSQMATRGVNGMTLTLFTALSIVCVVFGESFEKILNYTIFLDCIGMATAAGALFLLRDASPLSLSSRVLAIVFIASYVFIAGSIFRDDPAAGLYGIGLLALMIGGYWTVRTFSRST